MTDEEALRAFGSAIAAFDQTVIEVHGDQWQNTTPCTEWTTRDLVNHIVGEQRWAQPMLSGKTIDEVGDAFDGDLLAGDPYAAWEEAAKESQEAFGATGALGGSIHSSMGEKAARDYLDEMTFDLIAHRWDLGRSVGLEQNFTEPEIARLRTTMDSLAPMADQIQAAGVMAAPLDVSEGADEQTRILAAMGRRA